MANKSMLKAAAQKFLDKCDSGRARSRETQAELRAAMEAKEDRSNWDYLSEKFNRWFKVNQFATGRRTFRQAMHSAFQYGIAVFESELEEENTGLYDSHDMMCDEFMRIKAVTDNTEIIGLCDRGIKIVHQNVPLVKQRDNLDKECQALKALLIKSAQNSAGAEWATMYNEDRNWDDYISEIMPKHLMHTLNSLESDPIHVTVPESIRQWVKDQDI